VGAKVSHRRKALLRLVQADSHTAFADLSTALGVSVMTVRRDADWLAGRDLVQVVRAGVIAQSSALAPTKTGLPSVQSRGIVETSVDLARSHRVVGIVGNDLALRLVRRLAQMPITIVTNSISVMRYLSASEPVSARHLIAVGGCLDEFGWFVGETAEATIENLNLGAVFIEVVADACGQLAVATEAEARFARQVIDHSGFAALMVDPKSEVSVARPGTALVVAPTKHSDRR